MRVPANSPITLPFGATSDPYSPENPHKGTDFAYLPDNKIYAPFTGKVTLRPNNGRDGNGIYMYNGEQFHGLLHSSRYLVNDGDTVQEGQVIGLMGDTGAAQGVHLHWAVKVNGQFIDPVSLVEGDDSVTLADRGMVNALIFLGYGNQPTDAEAAPYVGKDIAWVIDDIANNAIKDGADVAAVRSKYENILATIKKAPADKSDAFDKIKDIVENTK